MKTSSASTDLRTTPRHRRREVAGRRFTSGGPTGTRVAILLVAGLQFYGAAMGAWTLLESTGETPPRAWLMVGTVALVGLVFLFLARWARKDPLAASLTALSAYVLCLAGTALLVPAVLLDPMLLATDLAIAVGLVLGVRSARIWRRTRAAAPVAEDPRI